MRKEPILGNCKLNLHHPFGPKLMYSLSLLAVCHTVIPEVRDGKMVYQASSPDEAALVAGAEMLGYRFHVSLLIVLVQKLIDRRANRNQSLSMF